MAETKVARYHVSYKLALFVALEQATKNKFNANVCKFIEEQLDVKISAPYDQSTSLISHVGALANMFATSPIAYPDICDAITHLEFVFGPAETVKQALFAVDQITRRN